MGRGGAISLIAICLFSVSGCLPRATGTEEQVTFIEEQITLVEEQSTVVVEKEVNEEGRAWHSAVWKFAAKWGGFLWKKLLGSWGLTKEAGSTAVEFGINYTAIAYEWGKPYADGIISISAATLKSVTSSAAYKKSLEVLSNPGAFLETYGRLSRFAKNLDWSKIDPTRYLYAGTRGIARSLEAAKGVWETLPLGALAQRLRLDIWLVWIGVTSTLIAWVGAMIPSTASLRRDITTGLEETPL